ncbi:serine protease inhibitor 77Ba-like [Coccinella septempunctata]|uniref:serine protease inhibitor 77Ba-like n=1 Tax=Coccinella septempunctata TaxID=41139 RepID=UPI001D082EE6|nr:serine protease inhibitor 77Ba-like [Coccinella septempunctata]
MSRILYFLGACFLCIEAQNSINIGDGLNTFATNLLQATADEAGEEMNLALSPYTVWSLLSIISEGARGNTLKELETVLNIPYDKTEFRNEYKQLRGTLQNTTVGVTLELSSGIFTNKKHSLKQTFQDRTKEYYSIDVMPADFKDLKASTELINNYVAKATNNRIVEFISQSDVKDAEIFLTSTLYFKGDWTYPFNKTATMKKPFFNEKGEEIGEADMMFLSASVAFLRLEALKAQAVLLPYGNGAKMSMVIILPLKGASITEVLELVNKMEMRTIIEKLKEAEQQFIDEDVNVFLPKFSISSDLNMNVVLDKMGLKEVFDSQKADLLNMVNQYLYVSRLIQKAEIDVDEEGTIAAAASGAAVTYKQQTPKFNANRPFIYSIVDMEAKSVVFNGVFRNPKRATKSN